jgi:hypothetical protein
VNDILDIYQLMAFVPIDACELFLNSALDLLIEMASPVVNTAFVTFVVPLGLHMIVKKSLIACCNYRDQLMQK